MSKTFNGLLLSDFNTDVLAGYLQHSSEPPSCAITSTPFGQVYQVLNDDQNPVWKHDHDFILLWCQPWALLPSFSKLLSFQLNNPDDIRHELEVLIKILKKRASQCRAMMVPLFILPPYFRGLGPIDYRKNGAHYWLLEINHVLTQELADLSNIFLLDTNRWINTVGPNAVNPKLWYLSKIPYDPAVFKMAAADIKSTLLALEGEAKKIIILDLDNVLWGGMVGESHGHDLKLGGHDPAGESFADFQRQLKNLKNRGILLAIVSKNDESTALKALREHPEMILKDDDFSGWKINWQDKAQNILDLLNELNLEISSAVFIDDHPAERDRVKKALPAITVPQWPEDSLLYAKTLSGLPYFDTVHFEREDSLRTQMYLGDKKRQISKEQITSVDDWLKSLHVTVTIEALTNADLSRAAQLLNKTNQMNLTTRRLTETEFFRWSQEDHHKAWTMRVKDDIGDSGLVGLFSLELHKDQTIFADFILSCRVFGRKLEEVMVAKAVQFVQQSSTTLVAAYQPTDKNKPCLDFWKRSGFKQENDRIFIWDLHHLYPYPDTVNIKDLTGDTRLP